MKTVKTRINKGFTLVEVLVALVILTVGMLAIFEGLVLYMNMNLNNFCRDEAVRIAEEKMNYFRNSGISQESGSESIFRMVRNFSRRFDVAWTAQGISSTSKYVKIDVTWVISGKQYRHSIGSILSSSE